MQTWQILKLGILWLGLSVGTNLIDILICQQSNQISDILLPEEEMLGYL